MKGPLVNSKNVEHVAEKGCPKPSEKKAYNLITHHYGLTYTGLAS